MWPGLELRPQTLTDREAEDGELSGPHSLTNASAQFTVALSKRYPRSRSNELLRGAWGVRCASLDCGCFIEVTVGASWESMG